MKIGALLPITDLFPMWMRRPGVPALLGNELRPVLPIFLSAFALIAVSCALPEDFRGAVALIASAFGSAALSGIVFGHDFTHRTLLSTLVQPVSRDQIWKTRFWISAGSTTTLGLVAALPIRVYQHIANIAFGGAPFWIPAAMLLLITMSVASICIAPFLTLLCRSALAGTVFTLCVPFILLYGGDYLWSLFVSPDIARPGFVVVLFLSFGALCVVGFFGARSLWAGLQVVDARPFSLQIGTITKSRADAPARRRSAFAQLLWKELRLQWLVVVPVVGMCATALSFRNSPPRPFGREMMLYATHFWAVLIALVLGAMGSSEERQLGMNEAQALLPISRLKQWLVKISVLLGLTSLFGVFLPLELLKRAPGLESIPDLRVFALRAALLVCSSAYISSCCRSTLKALLLSLPVSGALLVALEILRLNNEQLLRLPVTISAGSLHVWTALLAPYAGLGLLLFLLLRFASRNHFSAEHARPERGRQLIWLFAIPAATYLILVRVNLFLSLAVHG